MGCFASKEQDSHGNKKRAVNVREIVVFVPGLRFPRPFDFSAAFAGQLSWSMIERLTSLRSRIVDLAGKEGPAITNPKRKSSLQYGSALADLQQALEDYMPVLLGLVKNGNRSQHKLSYIWMNNEDDSEEHVIANTWYEVLSVLHLMAMLLFYQANSLLLPRTPAEGYQPKVSEESKRASVDIFLKAAGCLDCAIQDVLPCLPPDIRRNLPVDLAEGVLRALCLQALGQAVDIQLGIAIDSVKATLAVKRRLACEMVKYWQQALDNVTNLPLANGWGEKHQLFIKWKLNQAKAAAYYYHGLILDEGNTDESHGMAVAALQAADLYLRESNRSCERFNAVCPLTRAPPLWGTMKYLSEKIPRDTSSKVRVNRSLYTHEKIIMEEAPTLPDFVLALKPDDYSLPPVHPSWNAEAAKQADLSPTKLLEASTLLMMEVADSR